MIALPLWREFAKCGKPRHPRETFRKTSPPLLEAARSCPRCDYRPRFDGRRFPGLDCVKPVPPGVRISYLGDGVGVEFKGTDIRLRIPAGAGTLDGFCEWMHADDAPDGRRITFSSTRRSSST